MAVRGRKKLCQPLVRPVQAARQAQPLLAVRLVEALASLETVSLHLEGAAPEMMLMAKVQEALGV